MSMSITSGMRELLWKERPLLAGNQQPGVERNLSLPKVPQARSLKTRSYMTASLAQVVCPVVEHASISYRENQTLNDEVRLRHRTINPATPAQHAPSTPKIKEMYP